MTAAADRAPVAVGDALPRRQHNRRADAASLRFWSRSIGEMNPRYVDRAYVSALRGPAFAAHPCWLASVHNGVEYIGPAGTYPVIGRVRWTFERPVVVGEPISVMAWLIDEAIKETALVGRTLVHTIQVEYLGAGGDLIATALTTLFHVDPEAARRVGKHAGWTRSRYTDGQFAQIEDGYDHEVIRGAAALYADDVQAGDTLPRIVRGPLTSEEVVLFVGAVGPLPSNEAFAALYAQGAVPGFMHPESGLLESTAASLLDDASAVHLGFPAAHDMGVDRVAHCATLVANWMSDLGALRELDVRLDEPHMLGDTAWFDGTVTSVTAAENGTRLVDVDLHVTNQHGATIATGRAAVVLPQRRGATSAVPRS